MVTKCRALTNRGNNSKRVKNTLLHLIVKSSAIVTFFHLSFQILKSLKVFGRQFNDATVISVYQEFKVQKVN